MDRTLETKTEYSEDGHTLRWQKRQELKLGEKTPLVQIETLQFASGRNLAVFHYLDGQNPTSAWLCLDPNEFLTQINFNPQISSSVWFKSRFPNLQPDPAENFLLAVRETKQAAEVRVIDPTGGNLSTASNRHKPNEFLETTNYTEETSLIVDQKLAAKGRLTPYVLAELEKKRRGEASQCLQIGQSEIGPVYIYELTPESAAVTTIDGDLNSPSPKYNPKLKQAREKASGQKKSPAGPIQLLSDSDLLVFTMGENNQPTFYSARWGKATSTPYVDWKIGEPALKIKADIDLVTEDLNDIDRNRVRPRILKQLIYALATTSNWTFPHRDFDEQQSTLDQFLNSRIQAQLDRIEPHDTNNGTIVEYLSDQWLSGEINQLLELHSKAGREYRPFIEKFNHLPESLVYRLLNENSTTGQALVNIAKFDASLNLQTYIDQLMYVAGLISIGTFDEQDVQPTHARHLTVIDDLTRVDPAVTSAINRLGKFAITQLKPAEQLTFGKEVAIHRQAKIIRDRVTPLIGSNRIRSINVLNVQGLRAFSPGDTFVLSAQFCPLYTDDPRPLNEFAKLDSDLTGQESDIIRSAVGPKWFATQAVVSELHQVLAESGVKLKIKMSFGDIGAIVSKREWADSALLHQQSQIYQHHFSRFCDRIGIQLDFGNISDYPQDQLPETHRVPQYIVVEEGRILEEMPTLEEMLHMLDLNIPIDTKNRHDRALSFLSRLSMSGKNFDLARGLIHTYVSILPLLTEGADAQLGMELADIYLSLSSAIHDSRQAKMPAINVLAE